MTVTSEVTVTLIPTDAYENNQLHLHCPLLHDDRGRPAAAPATCAEVYIVQVNDWLSKIANKFLGDDTAYPAIIEATNQLYEQDKTFAHIGNPDEIEAGDLPRPARLNYTEHPYIRPGEQIRVLSEITSGQ